MTDFIKEIKKYLGIENDKDFYPEITKKAVDELWNNNQYSRVGLWNICFELLKRLLNS